LLSLKEAAEAAGVSRPAIFKAIKTGRMSATKDEKGQFQIDPAELFRVYTPPKPQVNSQNEPSLQAEIDGLRREIGQRDSRIGDLKDRIDDLKTDRDHWRQQATALLTHQPEPQKQQRREITPRGGGGARQGFLVVLALIASAAVVVTVYLYAWRGM
jgi:uncharacterized protein HemX